VTSRLMPSLFRGWSKSKKRPLRSPATVMSLLTVTTNRSMVITTPPTGRFIVPTTCVKTRRFEWKTNFYAANLPDGELIWTGTSDSFNPKSEKKVIDGLVKLIVKELTKQNVL
jgi:hypothetical protein